MSWPVTMFGHQKLYPQELYSFWVAYYPVKTREMSAVLVIALVHGCIGLHFWLRMKPFYKRLALFLLAGAVLVPTLELLGFSISGQMVIRGRRRRGSDRRNSPGRQQVGTAAEQNTLLDTIYRQFPARIFRPARPRRAGALVCACSLSGAAA